jgi:dihydrofolate synthase / folylpolyglutamate synthase
LLPPQAENFQQVIFDLMTYQETLNYLYSSLPMFSRVGSPAYKKDITNTVKLCEAVGNPQTKFKSVHIAGTNGKGSTSHMLAAVLQEAGYKTGLYTSPHLKDFRERIRLNGSMVREQFIIDFVENIKSVSEAIQPSFFELTVAMAFSFFAQEQVDVAVIETGLGGRLDSTNVITPELSIITNIGYDHQNILGDTLGQIAFEKAGIIKPGVPVVIGETQQEITEVFDLAASRTGSQIEFADKKYIVTQLENDFRKVDFKVVEIHTNKSFEISCDLLGTYQRKNIATVLNAVSVLRQRNFQITEQALRSGLAQVRRLTGLRGRWDIIGEKPTVVLDVAHNVDGIKQVLEQLKSIDHSNLHVVFGTVKDKDVNAVLSMLPKDARYYFANADIPRALPAHELQKAAEQHGLKGSSFNKVIEAFQAAKQSAELSDLILVCGSVFVVAEIPTDHEDVVA